MDYLQQIYDNDADLKEIIINENMSNDVLCQLSKALRNNIYVKKLCINGSFDGTLSLISNLLDQFDYRGIKNSVKILDLPKNYISSLSMYLLKKKLINNYKN